MRLQKWDFDLDLRFYFGFWFVFEIWNLMWILIRSPIIEVGRSQVYFIHIWNNRHLHLAWIMWYVWNFHSISYNLIWDWIIGSHMLLGLRFVWNYFLFLYMWFFCWRSLSKHSCLSFFYNSNSRKYYFFKCHYFPIMDAYATSFLKVPSWVWTPQLPYIIMYFFCFHISDINSLIWKWKNYIITYKLRWSNLTFHLKK